MANIPIEKRPTQTLERVQRDAIRHEILNAKTLEETKAALLHYIERQFQEQEKYDKT